MAPDEQVPEAYLDDESTEVLTQEQVNGELAEVPLLAGTIRTINRAIAEEEAVARTHFTTPPTGSTIASTPTPELEVAESAPPWQTYILPTHAVDPLGDTAPPKIDMTEARTRQTDLVDSTIFDEQVNVIGVGAIGSFLVLTLAKMGFKNICIFDNDNVGVENISNQFYPYSSIGQHKVWALADMIRNFEQLELNVNDNIWRNTTRLHGYVVMAVDTMAVRKQIYTFVKRNTDVFGFIDGRMGGQQAEVYSVNLAQAEHKKIYEQYLWSDAEASELPCTQKAVMYNVLWIASQIANNLRLMLEEKPFPPVMQMDFENVTHINVAQPKA